MTNSRQDTHALLHCALVFEISPVSGRQGITVVSDHRSMVLTYIDVGSVDTVYYIWHN